MTSDVPPIAFAPACAPSHEYSLNEWSSSWPTSVTKPTFANLPLPEPPAAEADAAADGALDEAAADGALDEAADAAVVGAALDPELLHAANSRAADASSVNG